MPVVTIDGVVYGRISRVMCIITIFFALLTLTFHIRQIRRGVTARKVTWSKSVIFSVILHISIIIFNGFFVWVAWIPVTSIPVCKIAAKGATIGYLVVKWSLYMCLSYRVDDAFHGSAYGYKPRTLFIWRAFLCLSVLSMSSWSIIAVSIELSDKLDQVPCRGLHPTSYLGTVVLIDIIACVVNMILFIRPLLKVSKQMSKLQEKELASMQNKSKTLTTANGGAIQLESPAFEFSASSATSSVASATIASDVDVGNSDQDKSNPNSPRLKAFVKEKIKAISSPRTLATKTEKNRKLLHVAKKFTILTAIGVGTTFITIVLIGLLALSTLWTGIDCICNITSILLMFGWNKKYYDKLCGWCH